VSSGRSNARLRGAAAPIRRDSTSRAQPKTRRLGGLRSHSLASWPYSRFWGAVVVRLRRARQHLPRRRRAQLSRQLLRPAASPGLGSQGAWPGGREFVRREPSACGVRAPHAHAVLGRTVCGSGALVNSESALDVTQLAQRDSQHRRPLRRPPRIAIRITKALASIRTHRTMTARVAQGTGPSTSAVRSRAWAATRTTWTATATA